MTVIELGCCVAALDPLIGCGLLALPPGLDVDDPCDPLASSLHWVEYEVATRALYAAHRAEVVEDDQGFGDRLEDEPLPDGRVVVALWVPALREDVELLEINESYLGLREELTRSCLGGIALI